MTDLPATRAARIKLACAIVGLRVYSVDLDRPLMITFAIGVVGDYDETVDAVRVHARRMADAGFPFTSWDSPVYGPESYLKVRLSVEVGAES